MNMWRQAKPKTAKKPWKCCLPVSSKIIKKTDFNWALDKNGLYFAFNPYSLGGYVNTAYFTLPANKLQGIVKPEWLHQSQGFHKTAKD